MAKCPVCNLEMTNAGNSVICSPCTFVEKLDPSSTESMIKSFVPKSGVFSGGRHLSYMRCLVLYNPYFGAIPVKRLNFGHIALAIEFYDNLLEKCKLYVAHGYNPNGQLIEYSERSAKKETAGLPGKLNIDEVSDILKNYIKIPLPMLNITPDKIKAIEMVLNQDFKPIKHMGGRHPVAIEKHSMNRIYTKKDAWTLHDNNCAHLAYDLLPQLGYEVGWWRAVFLRPYTMAKVAGDTANELLDRHLWDLCNVSKSLPPFRSSSGSPWLANPERGALADMLIDHHLQRLFLEEQLAKASHTGALSTVRKLKIEFLEEITAFSSSISYIDIII